MGSRLPTARINNAIQATFERTALECPFSQGAFRWVAKGRYTVGQRAGEEAVCKWFKSGGVYEESFFNLDIKSVDKAEEILQKWNDAQFIDRHVYLNRPEVWTFADDESVWAGRKALVEPFIANYQKFNSNTGWQDSGFAWGEAMQALSHFSYGATGGKMVLCDLQGGVYEDGVVLTDPVILSRDRSYGVTDLGEEGISTFFSRHKCNSFCRSHWHLPRNTTPYFKQAAGTSMIRMDHVPTRTSRPPLTHH